MDIKSLYHIFVCIIHVKKHKNFLKHNEFKISAPRWNKEFELPDGSFSTSDIQDYFMYIIKNSQTVTDNLPIRIYVNKIENRITFKIKTEHFL